MAYFFRKSSTKDNDQDLTRLIGYITATASDDWSLILEVCDRASASEVGAKTVADAIRQELLYAEPSSQLVAARLLGIILNQTPQDYFLSQSTSKKFLDAVERTINPTSSKFISSVVRDRLLTVLAGASALHGDEHPRFRSLWTKLKKPEDPPLGIPFEADDPTFFPTPSLSTSGQQIDGKERKTTTVATLTKKRTGSDSQQFHDVPRPIGQLKEKLPNLVDEARLLSSQTQTEEEDKFTFLNFQEVLRTNDVGLSASDDFRVTPQHGSFVFMTHTMTLLYKVDSRKVRQLMYDQREMGLDRSCNAVLSPDGNILVRRRSAGAPTEALNLRTKTVIATLEVDLSGDKRDLRRSVWVNDSTIFIPIQRKGIILKWSLGNADQKCIDIFQPLPAIIRHKTLEFHTSSNETWWAIAGKSLVDDRWQGVLQVYDVGNDESSVVNGSAAFIVETDVYDQVKPLLIVADSIPGNKMSISVKELHSDQKDETFISVECSIELHADKDTPVQIFVFNPLPIFAVVTHRNSLYFFELHSGTLLGSHHGLDTILRSSFDSKSIICQNGDESFQRISINEKDLIGWVRRVINNDTLASAMAIRTGLTGAEDVVVNDMHGRYDSDL
ncbi:hypothetical protein FRC02_011415 [Tulasnella sp. 418]|nr:hypothetical protein FRC02_011415 [Tulasnella sp. 418]